MSPQHYHNRKSIRLASHDYTSPGAYFITMCMQNRRRILSKIINAECRLTPAGKMITEQWYDIPKHFPSVYVDTFIAMPDHVHGILILKGDRTGGNGPLLGDVIGAYKSRTTYLYCQHVADNAWPRFHKRLWQRNYYERIIRDSRALHAIRRYIINNPAKWE